MEEGDVYSGAGSLTWNSTLRLKSWILSWPKTQDRAQTHEIPSFWPKTQSALSFFSGLNRGYFKQDYEKTLLKLTVVTLLLPLYGHLGSLKKLDPIVAIAELVLVVRTMVSASILTKKERKKETDKQTKWDTNFVLRNGSKKFVVEQIVQGCFSLDYSLNRRCSNKWVELSSGRSMPKRLELLSVDGLACQQIESSRSTNSPGLHV